MTSLANERMRTLMTLDAVLDARVRCLDLLHPEPIIFGRRRWRRIRTAALARLRAEHRQWWHAVLDADDLKALDTAVLAIVPRGADDAARLAIEEARAEIASRA